MSNKLETAIHFIIKTFDIHGLFASMLAQAHFRAFYYNERESEIRIHFYFVRAKL